MSCLFGEMNQWLLGDFGRAILSLLNANKAIFLTLFACYGFLLLYSKIIYMYYIPSKMRLLIAEHPHKHLKELLSLWKSEKGQIPWFILIPTKNEMWVQPLNRSNSDYQLLYFNRKAYPQNETDRLTQLLKAEGRL
ncbi:hypothetical protein I6N95_04550 [Vagococcus sp. BWB3-3]|uniref:Uncharacterized protein n=1 Tax=Vagococcus allomyrinae TaxID=2794353 RepID=A0A940PA61_9ENTE|nr:hypothetical protein [Vagococcus allomyrinae]MBP1040278.1 hypothetical protein [Vagococcus allomyrinae]